MALHQSSAVLHLFHEAKLAQTIEGAFDELKQRPNDGKHMSFCLQVFGGAAMIGLPNCRPQIANINWNKIDQGQGSTKLIPSLDRHDQQLWVGRREAVRLSSNTLTVPKKIGEVTLSLWRQKRESIEFPRDELFHSVMIQWLEDCKKAGWKLIHGEPIHDLLFAPASKTFC